MKLYDDIKSIILDSIHIKNFMCFDEFKVNDLGNSNIILIFGTNGSGKSTITSEAIFFALFGESIRYGKSYSELRNWNDVKKKNKVYVKLGLLCKLKDNNIIKLSIVREIDRNNTYNFKIDSNSDYFNELNNIIKKKEFNNIISNIIGVDKETFKLLYLKSPYSKAIFETSSDLIVNITKSNYIKELQKEFKDILKELQTKEKYLKESITQQVSIRESIEKEENISIDIDSYKDKLNKINEIITNIEKQINEYNNIYDKISENESKNDSNILKLSNKLENIKTNVELLKKQKNKYIKLIKMKKCPTCGQKTNKELYIGDIDNIDNKVNKYRIEYKEIKTELDKYKKYKDKLVDKKSKLKKTIDKLVDKKYKLKNTVTKINYIIKEAKKNEKNSKATTDKINKIISKLEEDLNETVYDIKIINGIVKKILSKNSKYINDFYNYKISSFLSVYNVILNKMSNSKYYSVNLTIGNKPILNGNIKYNALSTSQRKIVDIAFVVSYIVYMSKNMIFKTFLLDEFMEANFDKNTSLHLFNIIKNITLDYHLQFLITSNISDYLYNNVDNVKIIDISR